MPQPARLPWAIYTKAAVNLAGRAARTPAISGTGAMFARHSRTDAEADAVRFTIDRRNAIRTRKGHLPSAMETQTPSWVSLARQAEVFRAWAVR